MIEFEPLLDAIEAAALLRMHPTTLKMKARLRASSLLHDGEPLTRSRCGIRPASPKTPKFLIPSLASTS
jgi:hypothetical protein